MFLYFWTDKWGKKVEKINPLLGKIGEKHFVNYSKRSKIKKWKK